MKKVFVVIPNWNGEEWIGQCIESLLTQTFHCKIVMVDNGSVDASVALVEARYPDVHVIKLSTNTGFTGGVNAGISFAMTEGAYAVALFNNDAVADKNWLRKLVRVAESKPEVGIVACKLLQSDGKRFDSTGECYSIWGMPFPRGRNLSLNGQFEIEDYIFGASGGASLYRTKMLESIGLFDDKFFLYFEDVDISFRAQLAGWKITYCPSSEVFHRMSATSSKHSKLSRFHSSKNFFMLFTKNMPLKLLVKYMPLFTLQSIRLFGSSLIKGHLMTFLRSYFRFVVLLPQILRDRHEIQKTRKVSVEYIDSILYKHRPPMRQNAD